MRRQPDPPQLLLECVRVSWLDLAGLFQNVLNSSGDYVLFSLSWRRFIARKSLWIESHFAYQPK